MNRTLVIVNYMRSNPTIVDDLTINLKNDFKNIIIVNRNTKDNYKNVRDILNVKVKEVTRLNRFLLLPVTFFNIFRSEYIYDLKMEILNKNFRINILIKYLKNIHINTLIYSVLKNIDINENTTFLSIWLTNEAYSIAKLKKKYPFIRTISMAHAHEIESFDNKHTFWFKKFTHKYLDKIIFISQKKYCTYLQKVMVPHCIENKNITTIYWGSTFFTFSDYMLKNIELKQGYNIIVSCSTVEKLKRVDNILDIFLLLHPNTYWFHFGDGAEFDNLKIKLSNVDISFQKRIFLMGRTDNILVKNFYYYNDISLFINLSTTEGLPISVMEAISYSIPAIVTNVGGEEEIIINDFNGFLIESNFKIENIAKIINNYFDSPDTIKKQFATNAKKVWKEKFDLGQNIIKYKEVLIN